MRFPTISVVCSSAITIMINDNDDDTTGTGELPSLSGAGVFHSRNRFFSFFRRHARAVRYTLTSSCDSLAINNFARAQCNILFDTTETTKAAATWTTESPLSTVFRLRVWPRPWAIAASPRNRRVDGDRPSAGTIRSDPTAWPRVSAAGWRGRATEAFSCYHRRRTRGPRWVVFAIDTVLANGKCATLSHIRPSTRIGKYERGFCFLENTYNPN